MTFYIVHNGGKNNHNVYHTDETCHRLKQANGKREADKNLIEHYEMRECKYCAGTVELGKTGNQKYQKMIEEMANNE